MICIGLLLASCGEEKQPKSTVSAIESSEKTRTEWQKARKPVEIHIEDMEGTTPAWPRLGVYMDVSTGLPEERQAFAGTMFTRKGNVYVSENRHALTSDTMATISVCYPFRNGLGTNDTLRLTAPFTENLYGVETNRRNGSAIRPTFRLQSSMALLRIACESDDLRDRLDWLTITGERIYTQGDYLPYVGKWIEEKADGSIREHIGCLLNNGRNHDFYLIPTGAASSVTIGAEINGKLHAVRTTLPPLAPGSLVHLSLHKKKEGLAINGSWVETERQLVGVVSKTRVDSVCIGYYLQSDGTIREKKDTLSIAVVVKTDGRHGKAVALADCDGYYVFSGKETRSGRTFATIDGKRKEGILNPAEGIKADEAVIYKPGMPYPEDCALGYADGAGLTQRLLDAQADTSEEPPTPYGRRSMLIEARRHPGSYVPSLAEMAWLYYRTGCDKDFRRRVHLTLPEGEYLTSSESGERTSYRIDFTCGIVTGQLSKRYAKGKLRLFYLF